MEKVKLIQGTPERAEEIRKTLEEWGGKNIFGYKFIDNSYYYYIDARGNIVAMTEDRFNDYIKEGLYEIYELPPLKPKREFKHLDKVLVRDDDSMNWFCDFFLNLETDEDRVKSGYIYRCIGSAFKQCVKYEGNEHLLGTTDNPK